MSESTSQARVLIVEDEDKTRASLAEGFGLESWNVATAATADEAIRACDSEAFDLVVLDWMLPDRDGIDVLNHIRARGLHTPVLMLTARGTVADRVLGLETGADDFLPKPFAFAELIARARALLRRPLWASSRVLSCGDLQVDTRARTAMRGDAEIPLTPREVDVLEYLLRYQGQVVTREMLERDVWKQKQRLTSLDNVIDVQMMRLRRKIDGEAPVRLIRTVRGVGYVLGAEGR